MERSDLLLFVGAIWPYLFRQLCQGLGIFAQSSSTVNHNGYLPYLLNEFRLRCAIISTDEGEPVQVKTLAARVLNVLFHVGFHCYHAVIVPVANEFRNRN